MSADEACNIVRKDSPMAKQSFYRLVIDASGEQVVDAHSLNKALAVELLKLRPRQRSLQMDRCLVGVLKRLPENAVVKDIDVLFNPGYTVDVLKVLISAYRHRPFRLIWPGTYRDGKLIYSEEGYFDYRVYNVCDYDIICIQ